MGYQACTLASGKQGGTEQAGRRSHPTLHLMPADQQSSTPTRCSALPGLLLPAGIPTQLSPPLSARALPPSLRQAPMCLGRGTAFAPRSPLQVRGQEDGPVNPSLPCICESTLGGMSHVMPSSSSPGRGPFHLPAWLRSVSSCAGLMSFTAGRRRVSTFLLCRSHPGLKPKARLRTCRWRQWGNGSHG